MRLLLPLVLLSMSGACLAQTQHVTDMRTSTPTLVQPEPGAAVPQTPFSGPEPLSSSLFRSSVPDTGTYDSLGMRQVKPGVADSAAGCKQHPAPPYGCAAR